MVWAFGHRLFPWFIALKLKKADALQTAKHKGWLEEPLYNEDTDSLWFVSNDTLTHSFSNIRADRGEITLLALQHLDEIVQDARLVSVDEPKNPNKAESRVHTFFAAVRQGKDVVPVKMTVKEYAPDSTRSLPENVKKHVNNHGEVDEYAKLYDVVALEVVGNERETTDASGNGSSAKAEGTTTPMVSEISVADLLALVNGNARKYIPPRRENRTGGTENVEDHTARRGGTDLSDGDKRRVSGESAGEQAGRVSGRGNKAGKKAEQAGKAIARQAAVREGKGVKRSSLELGVSRGTDDLTLTELMPEDWDADLQAAADEVMAKTGLACRFVVGAIPLQGTKGIRYARGVYTGTAIIVQADNPRITAAQIARHEMFHHMASEDRGMAKDLADRLILNDRTDSSREMVEAYIQNYQGIIDIPEDADQDAMDAAYQQIYEEILADAYAEVNAFGAGATRYTDPVQKAVEASGWGSTRQTAAAAEKTTGPPEKETVYSIDPEFAEEFRTWYKSTDADDRITDGGWFRVGETSDVLRSVGVKDGIVYWRRSKVGYIMQDHPEMTPELILQIPEIIEDPIIVLKSLTQEDSIVAFSEITAADGRPIMVALNLTPMPTGGMEAEFVLIASAYSRSRDNAANLVKRSDILYLSENKKRTDTWLMSLGLQLPSGQPAYGPIGSISYSGRNVNIRGVPFSSLVKSESSFSADEPALAGEVVPEYDRDMAEQAARKQGYPVISGVQVVPNKTYVRTEKRQNYGLVIGTAPNDAHGRQNLWVMFKNKQDGTMATVALPVDELQPTDAMYQPTYEELESLLASAPEEVTHEEAPEDYYGADERVTDNDPLEVELEKMPVKAKQYLQRAERAMISSMARALHMPGYARKEFLNGAVREISREVVRTGTVEDGTIRRLFEKAYAEGRVVNREFYDQYKPVKDYLRTQAVTLPEDLRSDAAMAMVALPVDELQPSSQFSPIISKYCGKSSCAGEEGNEL